MANDFKSPSNFNKLLELLQDVKDKDLYTNKIDDLVKSSPRTSSVTGDLFKTVGKATGESYGAGYKPNFVLQSADDMLPAVVKKLGGNQVIPTNGVKDIIGEAVEVGARNLPSIAKNTLPSVGKQVAKTAAKGVGTAGLAALGALLDETATEAPGYNTPEIKQLMKETALSKLPPEALSNLDNILAGQPDMVQKENMSRMSPEQIASLNTPPEAQNEAENLSNQISNASPEKIKEQLKTANMASKPQDPYAKIKAELDAFKKGSKEDLDKARSKDSLLEFLNSMNKGLARYDQAAASTGSRQAQQVMEALQVNPQFAKMAKEDQESSYKSIMDKLGLAKDQQNELLTKEYRDSQLSEKEKDRQLQRDLTSQKIQADMQEAMLKAKEKGNLTPGQEALDKAYAKDYADYVAGGGFSQAKGDISRLEKVMQDISKNKDMFTGPVDSLTESLGGFDAIRSVTNPKLQDVKDRLEQIIQQDLRKTLGAQFTEKEGAQFLARSFNPKLSADENIARIKGFISDVKTRADQKEKAAKYFEQKGTLDGFKGDIRTPNTEAKIEGNTSSPQELAPNEVIRMDSTGRKIVYDKDTKKPLREIK